MRPSPFLQSAPAALPPLARLQTATDDVVKSGRIASLLDSVFSDADDMALLSCAADTLGHLVRSGGAMTADIVEKEVSPTQARRSRRGSRTGHAVGIRVDARQWLQVAAAGHRAWPGSQLPLHSTTGECCAALNPNTPPLPCSCNAASPG
jgi:hypothetical protein